MQARIMVIEEKLKAYQPELAGPSNFKVRDGGAVDAQILLQNPNLTLYCLDFENRQALFVETPPECDLSHAPFLYQAQYQAATRLIQIPYETLHRLAAEVVIDPAKLILIYSIGRCGSTLVSSAFNEIEGVDSLSEPDVFTKMCNIWGPQDFDGSEELELLKSCTRLQCAPGRLKGARAWALKFRSEVTTMWPMFYSVFPEAKVVFLYRKPEPWARSIWRYVQMCFPSFASSGLTTPNPERGGSTVLDGLASRWLSGMQKAQEMQRRGIPMFVVRYEELNAAPRDVLTQMFAYCGFAENAVGNLDAVLEQDAQAGTALSRENLAGAPIQLTAEHLEELRRLIHEGSPEWTADTILPGTYFPSTMEKAHKA